MHKTLDELTKIYNRTDKGSLGHNYVTIYEKYMFNKKEITKNVLELGAGSGDSLRMWRDYFPNTMVYSVDIADLNIKENRIKVYIGKQEDTNFLGKVCNEVNDKFDFIIDDACHGMSQQLTSLNFLLPYLKDDGYYFIEDIQISLFEYTIEKINQNKQYKIIEIYRKGLNFASMIVIKKKQ